MYFVEEKRLWKIFHRLVHSLFHAFLFLLSVFKKGFFFIFSGSFDNKKRKKYNRERSKTCFFFLWGAAGENWESFIYSNTHTSTRRIVALQKMIGSFLFYFCFCKKIRHGCCYFAYYDESGFFFFLKNDGNKSNKHEKQIPPGSASSGLKILSIRLLKNIKIKNTA